VLGFAVWLAVTESGSDGVRHVKRALGIQRQAAAARAAAGSPHGAAVPRAGVGRGGPAVRAAWTPPCGRTPGTAALQVAGTPRTAGGNSTAHRLQAGFNRAADVVRPSVVNINAVRRSGVLPRPTAPNAPRFADPFDGVPDKVIAGQAFESIGSGVIVDERGYVLTNNHLVSRATMIMVTRFNHNNEHLPADLVAADPSLDLALLRLRGAAKFPPASFANSSQVEVGDWVLAVGNPFGLGHTVTSGIVSARRQQLTIGNVSYSNLLQTDAPINRGSSGGPLCDLDGKIVGINTAIYAPTGVFSGAGFAIPANRAASSLLPTAITPRPNTVRVSRMRNTPNPTSMTRTDTGSA